MSNFRKQNVFVWLRRTERIFRRRSLKYCLICLFLTTIIFVANQLLYFKIMNQVNVGKLISGSVRTPNYKEARTVSLRGVSDKDFSKYLPNARGKFVCFSSNDEIDFSKINDNYCDCPADGSDEPGTNACNNGVFNCRISSTKMTGKIPSYKVNDGYCDCCDGSDEWAELKLSRVNNGKYFYYSYTSL
ncbi:glucosidase 2 subunit beta [Ceratina calcarata]|uniref:Glucosidase 2 subunit beta n=1 Tax=Ceratina calcarata TaxID=156304 RepID=A0AAJ7J299_9HYME|nr:glucosidase 2 subunit beta [Ceratina calcarata]